MNKKSTHFKWLDKWINYGMISVTQPLTAAIIFCGMRTFKFYNKLQVTLQHSLYLSWCTLEFYLLSTLHHPVN